MLLNKMKRKKILINILEGREERRKTLVENFHFSEFQTEELIDKINLYFSAKNSIDKINKLKKSRLLKFLYRIGLFKNYKYL